MNRQARICPLCHKKIVKYKHTLSLIMIRGLRALYNAGGRARLDNLNLTHSEFTNFQKLRYFGLAVNERNEWILTSNGALFLAGKIKIHKSVITENAIVVGKSLEKVAINEIKKTAQLKTEWQDQASQLSLFNFFKKIIGVSRE